MKKADMQFQITAILTPPEGVVFPFMRQEDLLLDLFKQWMHEIVGEDVKSSGQAVFMWRGQDWTTPKVEGWNNAKQEIREKINAIK